MTSEPDFMTVTDTMKLISNERYFVIHKNNA